MQFFEVGSSVLSPNKFSQKNEDGTILAIQKDVSAYIRFTKQDQRLDEWIPLRRLSHNLGSKNKQTTNIESIIRNIEQIRYGDFSIQAWYYSPYPSSICPSKHLYICPYCFEYFQSPELYQIHRQFLPESKPKGLEIYRKDDLSIFEINSTVDRLSCQLIYLLSKLFLENSVLTYNVDNVTFYILCKCDDKGAHPVGFYSRPTNFHNNIILSEIVILPPFHKQGYSQILISCAYEIAHRSMIIGGIEHPLNDLGTLAFEKYFKYSITSILQLHESEIRTIKDISLFTSICKNDVISTLKQMNLYDEESEIDWNQLPDYLRENRIDVNERIFCSEYLMYFTERYEEEEDIQRILQEYDDSEPSE